jgi:hypothetical protein
MPEHEKKRMLNVQVTALDMAKAHALADDLGETISAMLRRMLRDAYRARFGEATPGNVTLRTGVTLSVAPPAAKK